MLTQPSRVFSWQSGELPVLPQIEPQTIDPLPTFGIGKYEAEVLVAQLLQFSIEQGRWVGVSLRDLLLRPGILRNNLFRLLPTGFGLLTRWSGIPATYSGIQEYEDCLGGGRPDWLWQIFHPVSTLKSFWQGKDRTFLGGFPAFQMEGIDVLLKCGFIQIVRFGIEDVVYPTPKLIEQVIAVANDSSLFIPPIWQQMPWQKPCEGSILVGLAA